MTNLTCLACGATSGVSLWFDSVPFCDDIEACYTRQIEQSPTRTGKKTLQKLADSYQEFKQLQEQSNDKRINYLWSI